MLNIYTYISQNNIIYSNKDKFIYLQILKDKIILISNYENKSIIESCATDENNIFRVQKDRYILAELFDSKCRVKMGLKENIMRGDAGQSVVGCQMVIHQSDSVWEETVLYFGSVWPLYFIVFLFRGIIFISIYMLWIV